MNASASTPFSLRARHRQRGRADVILMILMIVLVIGAASWAFVEANKYNTDEPWVVQIEALAKRPFAELQSTREVAEAACNPLGFKGEDGLSDYELMVAAVTAIDKQRFAVRFPSSSAVSSTDEASPLLADDGTGKLVLRNVESGEVHSAAGTGQIIDILKRQDLALERLAEYYRSWNLVRGRDIVVGANAQAVYEHEFKTRQEEFATQYESYSTHLSNEMVKVETSHTNEAAQRAAAQGWQKEQRDSIESEVERYKNDTWALMSDAERAADHRAKAEQLLHIRASVRAAQNENQGVVLAVDETSGWVWINLGKEANVRTEQRFQVMRRSDDGRSDRKVADIRVKEVIGGRLSRCRIDSRESIDSLPRANDGLVDPNFTSQRYTYYAFAGTFGGGATKLSKQQLIQLLRDHRMIIVDADDPIVEVIIFGENPQNDRVYTGRDDTVRFTPMTEGDILYMLGED